MAYLLQHLLTDSAARAPRRPAVAVGDRSLTYAELDQLSNQVARALLAQGVVPGDRVGILARKSAASVVALYGVLKAGACYVPLDPKQPAARLAAIMADSGMTVVLADQATAPQAAALAEAAAAKLFTSEAWVASSLDAIQVHGAYGYMKESGIERDLRDAVASRIYSGTSEIQRVIMARMLGL